MKNTWIAQAMGSLGYFLAISTSFVLLLHGKSSFGQQTAFNPAAIDDFVERQMAVQRVPGLALAITQGEEVLYVKGYGTAGNGRPVTPQTQFFIASVSKSFTALAVMQLVEAGLVDLDTPVQTYLPHFTLADPALASRITIRHLLNQTSGLSELDYPDMQLPQPETIEERVSSLRDARPAAPPGTEYHYFSPNYGVLARVVEVVSEQPFSEYLDAQIFSPLAMEDTLSVITSTEGKHTADNLAMGNLVAFGIPFPYPEADGYLGGSGGVISTAEDMANYLILQNSAGRFMDQVLVAPESLQLTQTPPATIDSNYAMGWTERVGGDLRILEHSGVLSTYFADAVLVPEEGIGIALLYNVSSFPTIALASPQIKDGLLALMHGEQPESGGLNVSLWGFITGLLTLAGGFLATRSLLRLPQWAQKARTAPWWRLLPGIAWKFAPALTLVAGLPTLSATFSDRVFGLVNFYKSLLGIFVWLALTGVLGVIEGSARIAILLRRFSKSNQI